MPRRRSAAERSGISSTPTRQPGPSSTAAADATVRGASLPSRWSTRPMAKRSSGRSVRISTRTRPCRPCALRTRPTTTRVGSLSVTRSEDLERDRAALAGGGDLQEGPERLRDAAVAAYHLAHVVLGDMQLDDGPLIVFDGGHLDGIPLVYEESADVLP